MPSLIGPWITGGDTSEVDSTQKHELGTRACDASGNEFIYLKGLDATVIGSVVSFDEVHVTALADANDVGRIGVAMASIVTDTFGWYQIYGFCEKVLAINDGDCAADVQVFLTATDAHVDDVDVAGDAIIGMISRVAETVTEDQIGAELNYPFVCNVAID